MIGLVVLQKQTTRKITRLTSNNQKNINMAMQVDMELKKVCTNHSSCFNVLILYMTCFFLTKWM